MTHRPIEGRIIRMSTLYPGSAGALESTSLEAELLELGDRADRLGAAQAGFASRVRSLECDGLEVPESLRRKLAAFSADVDEFAMDLTRFS